MDYAGFSSFLRNTLLLLKVNEMSFLYMRDVVDEKYILQP